MRTVLKSIVLHYFVERKQRVKIDDIYGYRKEVLFGVSRGLIFSYVCDQIGFINDEVEHLPVCTQGKKGLS